MANLPASTLPEAATSLATTRTLYVCQGPNCGARAAAEVLAAAQQAVARLPPGVVLEVLPSGCRNRCEEGVTAALFPGGQKLRWLTPANVATAIADALVTPPPVELPRPNRVLPGPVQLARMPLRPRRWR